MHEFCSAAEADTFGPGCGSVRGGDTSSYFSASLFSVNFDMLILDGLVGFSFYYLLLNSMDSSDALSARAFGRGGVLK